LSSIFYIFFYIDDKPLILVTYMRAVIFILWGWGGFFWVGVDISCCWEWFL